jgi:hypothetical protein
MRTHIHIAFSLLVYFIILKAGYFSFSLFSLTMLLSAELIDLDHLFSKPIYKKGRNPFATHFLHRHWYFVIPFALFLLFFPDFFTLGLGLLCHLFIDVSEVIFRNFIHKV